MPTLPSLSPMGKLVMDVAVSAVGAYVCFLYGYKKFGLALVVGQLAAVLGTSYYFPYMSPRGVAGSYLISSPRDYVARAAVDTERGIATQPLKCISCDLAFSAKQCLFHCHACQKSSICLECVLHGMSPAGCCLRSAVIEAQDLRPTFISALTDSEFRALVQSAQADTAFRLPHKAKRFLSHCDLLQGVTRERLHC